MIQVWFQHKRSAEVRFVTYNTKYGRNLEEAIRYGDGAPDTLAYFSVFLDADDGAYSEAYDHIFKGITCKQIK